jgi:gamma-glutamyltranspeptidase
LPDEVIIEKGFSEETKNALQDMGYKCVPENSIGRTELIKILYGDSSTHTSLEAAADKRGDDSVAGY